jgi:hypothetical protein
MLRVISRPITVPADRSIDRKADDDVTFSTSPGSSLGARGSLLRGGAEDGAGAGAGCSSGVGAVWRRCASIS